MKLYKYKDLSKLNPEVMKHLKQIVVENKIWCSRPAALNDENEFLFECDYTLTDSTIQLLSQLRNHSGSGCDEALPVGQVSQEDWETQASFYVERMKSQCREKLGIACFSTSADNNELWKRYGGNGNGVCIEIDVPDNLVCIEIDVPGNLMNKQFFKVTYVKEKRSHIDSILKAALGDAEYREVVYRDFLLTKKDFWQHEAEVRFISERQDVLMCMEPSRVMNIVPGRDATPETISLIQSLKAKMTI